ncbi:MAG: histidine phosphatase family protein [Helicobacteraceae bacterium]|nr:histidine phosphatase family protein [Candidatus Sulfurimonas ponti]
MILTLVRHAQVIEEYQGRYNGHLDIELSVNGKLQAKKVAKKLQNIEFDKVYCSDLIRCRQTLSAFNLQTNIIYTHRLREKSWGRHEGKSFEEIEAQGIKYENFQQWINALDGENTQEYISKLKEYFNETIFKEDSNNILIVTHSGVIKTLLHLTENILLEEAFATILPYSSYITLDTMSL